jgi:excisionase family DNA binding protein
MTTPKEAPDLLTTKQAAARLGFKPVTVLKWIREGRLACVRYGPVSLRIPASAVEALIAKSTIPAA